MDGFATVFVEQAVKHGLDTALKRFKGRVPDGELQEWVAEYKRMTATVRIGYPPKILSAPGLGEPWYPGPLEDDKRWPAFKRDTGRRLSGDAVDLLDESTSKIVAYTHSPALEKYRTKGLVVGYVQSGKTTSFTGVAAKLADSGYRLVIVLSGIHNGLRRQTQERLQAQLINTAEDGAWFPLTDELKDFHKPVATAATHLQRDDSTLLIVAKKNRAVLTKIIRWLSQAAKAGSFDGRPVVVIDDEADQASVATARINPQIRTLLGLFPRCTYLGYTATPFANVLIDPTTPDDLYPETFILSLPEPEGYFGAEKIFGRDALEGELAGAALDGYDMIRIIPADTVDEIRPVGRGSEKGFTPTITDELAAALGYFAMATAARRARGDRDHSTMLIHPSMKTAVHDAYREPLRAYFGRLAAAVTRGDESVLDALHEQWEDEAARVDAADFANVPVSFDDVRNHLPEVLHQVEVVVDNFRSPARLDYTGPDPVVAVAVGGNTLSRGLTLEGLVVSFFVRAANTYDTLLQMGRWFGYRRGYEDLPRIWMTEALRDDFRHLAMVEAEIRQDIQRYEEQDMSPRDVGVRIRTHPSLNITAKMGAARTAYASYGGQRVQVRYFREDDRDWLATNQDAAARLVAAALAEGAALEVKRPGTFMLRDVGVRNVLGFLASYQVHADSPDLEPRLVTSYIEKENRRRDGASLLTWNLAVMGGPIEDEDHVVEFAPEVRVGTVERSKLKDTGGAKADIKTLMSKDHRVVDMDITVTKARSKSEQALMDMRDADPEFADRGLLLLYPIAKDSKPDEANVKSRVPLEAAEHVIGMALVFPGSTDGVANRYVQVETGDDSEYDEIDAAIDGDDQGSESS